MRPPSLPRHVSLALPVLCALCALPIGFASRGSGAIIGTNVPSQVVTRERISRLPKPEQADWKQYLKRSERQWAADQAFLQKEMRRHGLKTPIVPPSGRSAKGLRLSQSADWYRQPEAKRIADIVISFQTPAGGWSKNLDMTSHRRAPGEHFAPNNGSTHPNRSDYDAPGSNDWAYVGTFDNDATVIQLRYLAKVIAAGADNAASCRQSFLCGLDYILAAQYPNGGWPQVWPLQGGYHDAITFNDSAMINVMGLLRDISSPDDEFAFVVPVKRRAAAAASLQRGLRCILATQIVVNGRRTVWGQQHDPITLQPASARNYEMPSQAAAESAGIMLFLMRLPDPNPEIIAAVRAAAEWLEKTSVRDVSYTNVVGEGRRLTAAPGGGPVWSRFYEIGSDRPVFGDRDKSVHDRLEEISLERRSGYAWYGSWGNRALAQYRIWGQKYPQGGGGGLP